MTQISKPLSVTMEKSRLDSNVRIKPFLFIWTLSLKGITFHWLFLAACDSGMPSFAESYKSPISPKPCPLSQLFTQTSIPTLSSSKHAMVSRHWDLPKCAGRDASCWQLARKPGGERHCRSNISDISSLLMLSGNLGKCLMHPHAERTSVQRRSNVVSLPSSANEIGRKQAGWHSSVGLLIFCITFLSSQKKSPQWLTQKPQQRIKWLQQNNEGSSSVFPSPLPCYKMVVFLMGKEDPSHSLPKQAILSGLVSKTQNCVLRLSL